MSKIINIRTIWLISGVLCSFIVIGILLALPAIINAESGRSDSSSSDFTRIYKNALIAPLKQATVEATDPQLARFSQKLILSYDLERTGENANQQSNLSDLLPDLKKINKAAINMPLKEAGKQIQDKDISEFYTRFIDSCGANK